MWTTIIKKKEVDIIKTKQDLISYLKLIVDFNTESDDFKLKADEYVRIVGLKTDKEGQTFSKIFFIQTVAELDEIIKKYKYTYNLYITIATCKGKNSTAEYMNARQVIFLDFDKKDFPQYSELKDFTAHVKRILPVLFNHCIVDSGNGYHFIIATRKTLDNTRATRINKSLVKILGADPKAASPTQLMRIPTSLNLKHESKLVNIVTNNYGEELFKPYDLNKLEKIISYAKQVDEIKSIEPLQPKELNKSYSYFCIESMIAKGTTKGERNFCLGRIVKYLQQIKGYNYNGALKLVQEWNRRCNPPKSVDEIANDFDRYWHSNYKLLGCKLDDEGQQAILNRFCEKANCNTIFKEAKIQIKNKEVLMDNQLLKNDVIRKLRGNHYLILSVLHINDKGLTLAQMKNEIVNPTTGKCCLSKNTLSSVLIDLLNRKYISYYQGIYKLIDLKNFGLGFTRYYYSATILLINGIIKQQDYLVYLCLVRNLQKNKDVTYDTISDDTGIDKGNISRHINNLFKSKILCVEKSYNEKGILYNSYTLVA